MGCSHIPKESTIRLCCPSQVCKEHQAACSCIEHLAWLSACTVLGIAHSRQCLSPRFADFTTEKAMSVCARPQNGSREDLFAVQHQVPLLFAKDTEPLHISISPTGSSLIMSTSNNEILQMDLQYLAGTHITACCDICHAGCNVVVISEDSRQECLPTLQSTCSYCKIQV